jgi:hypothetical protein
VPAEEVRIFVEFFREQWRNDPTWYTLRQRLVMSWRMALCAVYVVHWQEKRWGVTAFNYAAFGRRVIRKK